MYPVMALGLFFDRILVGWIMVAQLFLIGVLTFYYVVKSEKSFQGEYKHFEVKRKLFHLSAFLVVIPMMNLGPLIDEGLKGITEINPSLAINITSENILTFVAIVIIGAIIPIIVLIETVRIYKGISLVPTNLLRTNEKKSVASYTYTMIAILLVALLFKQPILLTSIVVGLIADAMAAMVGVYYGKHKITKNRTLAVSYTHLTLPTTERV